MCSVDQPYVYLDNASTSHPKPSVLWETTKHYINSIGASPGRSGHAMARAAGQVIDSARTLLAQLFNVREPEHIVFALNATHALNIAIKGALRAGDHVVTTNSEHTSVLRPLERLRQLGVITYDVVRCNELGIFTVSDFEAAIKPNTRLIAVNHASNVIGVVAPIHEIGAIARARNISFLVDASQTAGVFELDVERDSIDFLAFTGHKSLLGPSGTGGVYIHSPHTVETLYEGGTGNNSHSLLQPEDVPVKFEAGTVNYLGIAGLAASVQLLLDGKMEEFRRRELAVTEYCLQQLATMPEIQIFGTRDIAYKAPVISFNVQKLFSGEVAHLLDEHHGIMVRPGLQCAPLIHKTLGTFPQGTVRVSFGHANIESDVDYLMASLKKIVSERNRR